MKRQSSTNSNNSHKIEEKNGVKFKEKELLFIKKAEIIKKKIRNKETEFVDGKPEKKIKIS